MFTDNEILLDRVPCFYFYYTLTTTTKIMFSIITNHKTVDDTEKNCKKFQALHFESNKHNFQNHVYQCNAPRLNLRRCNVFFKQHTLANVGNTRHLLLLIWYFQPKKKVSRDHNEDCHCYYRNPDSCTLFYHRAVCCSDQGQKFSHSSFSFWHSQ